MNNSTKAYHKFLNFTIEVSDLIIEMRDLIKFYRTREIPTTK